MECFQHAGRPAVGSCRACLRGVCRAGAGVLGRGLACAGACEQAARALIASLEQTVRMQALSGSMMQGARTLWVGLSVVALAVGVFVIGFGLSLPQFRGIALLGIPFLAIGALTLIVARRVRRSATVS